MQQFKLILHTVIIYKVLMHLLVIIQGGIVGFQCPFEASDYTNNSIFYCYNVGNVTGSSNFGSVAGHSTFYNADYIYGLTGTSTKVVGYEYQGKVSKSGLLGKSDLISMILTNYGSNFEADESNINGGYPILRWQK